LFEKEVSYFSYKCSLGAKLNFFRRKKNLTWSVSNNNSLKRRTFLTEWQRWIRRTFRHHKHTCITIPAQPACPACLADSGTTNRGNRGHQSVGNREKGEKRKYKQRGTGNI